MYRRRYWLFENTYCWKKNANQPNIAQKQYRNVSIITENSEKDQLNKLGSLHFAKDKNQKLTDFYSDDELGEDIDPSTLTSICKKVKKSIPSTKKQLSPDMQNALWNLWHSASEHIPGKLLLCIGLPVIVRATAEQLSQDLAGDPKYIYKHKIQQESTPSRGS